MSAYYQIDYSDLATKLMPHILRSVDFVISEGDFLIGNTNEQESYIILETSKGNFYAEYNLGVNIKKNIGGDVNKIDLRQEIKENLKLDNFKINKIYIVTANDVEKAKIDDPQILSVINNDGFLISLDIDR